MSSRLQLVSYPFALGLCALTLGAFPINAAERPAPREKIHVSEVPGGLALPGVSRRPSPLDDSFEFLDRQSSVSGAVIPYDVPVSSGVPSKQATMKMLDKMDRQKNWMFQNQPGNDARDANAEFEEAFGGNDYDLNSSRRPKGSMERYLENSGRDMARATNSPARDDAEPDVFQMEADRRFQSPLERQRTARKDEERRKESDVGPFGQDRRTSSLAGRSAFEAMRGAAQAGSFSESFTRNTGFSDRLGGRDAEFRKLLEPTIGASLAPDSLSRNPLGGVLDPVNLSPDLTRQELNPVTPNIAPTLGQGVGARSILDSTRSLNTAIAGPSPGGLFDGVARPLGSSSLSPSLIEPPRPAMPAPQPAMLVIPRRPR